MGLQEPNLSVPQALFEQVERLAQHLHLSHNQVFEMALESFVRSHQTSLAFDGVSGQSGQLGLENGPKKADGRLLQQGDIFWIESQALAGTEMGTHRHPYVVVQDDLFNHSRVHSVVVCALTTNLKQATAPGNVLLEVGEANLPKQSAVVVSKVSAVNRSQLGDYIGSLDKQRVEQILAGMRFLQTSYFGR